MYIYKYMCINILNKHVMQSHQQQSQNKIQRLNGIVNVMAKWLATTVLYGTVRYGYFIALLPPFLYQNIQTFYVEESYVYHWTKIEIALEVKLVNAEWNHPTYQISTCTFNVADFHPRFLFLCFSFSVNMCACTLYFFRHM